MKHVHLDGLIQATGTSYMIHQTFHAVFMDYPNLQSAVDSADSLKNPSSSFGFTSGLNPDELLYGGELTVVTKRMDINPLFFFQ